MEKQNEDKEISTEEVSEPETESEFDDFILNNDSEFTEEIEWQ